MNPNAKTRFASLFLILATMLGLNTAMPSAAVAADTSCATQLGLERPSKHDAAVKTPVVLVHGMNSKAGDLAAFDKAISPKGGVTYRFDYGAASNQWVATGDTAQRLTQTLVCYSRLYGDKKVAIAAYSMGGLVTRAALPLAAYGTFARDVVGHVVTIGTPNQGAPMGGFSYIANVSPCKAAFVWWGDEAGKACETIESTRAASAMRPGSPELAALPRIPKGISVRAIAGNVSTQVCVTWGCTPAQATNADLVVPVSSAVDGATYGGVADGQKVFECSDPIAMPIVSSPWCSHNSMLGASQVQADVRASIERYIAAAKPAVPTTKPSPKPSASGKAYQMLGLTLHIDPEWGVHGSDERGWVIKTGDTFAGYYNPTFNVDDFSWLDGDISTFGEIPQCTDADYMNNNAKLIRKGTRNVGGRQVAYYEAKPCTDGSRRDETFRVWELTVRGKKVVINTTEWPGYSVEGLDTILANATL